MGWRSVDLGPIATPRHESYTCGNAEGRPSGASPPVSLGAEKRYPVRVSLRLEINPDEHRWHQREIAKMRGRSCAVVPIRAIIANIYSV